MYVLDCAAHERARLGDFGARHGGCALRLASRPIDRTVSRHHGLRGLLQLLELRRLVRDPRRHFFEVTGDVRHLDSQGADATCQLGNQARAIDLEVAAHDIPWCFRHPWSHIMGRFARVLQVFSEWNTSGRAAPPQFQAPQCEAIARMY